MEHQLFFVRECFVYRVPPLDSTGYRAADWDLANPALTGSLKVLESGDVVRLKIYEPNGAVFAVCPIKLDADVTKPRSSLEFFVQGVKDSSRYFVIRCEQEDTGKHAYIGVGVRDRDVAFNLRATLQDQLRSVARQRDAPSMADEAAADAAAAERLNGVKCEAGQLSKGETIKLDIKLGGKKTRKAKKADAETAGGIPEEEWGDFQS